MLLPPVLHSRLRARLRIRINFNVTENNWSIIRHQYYILKFKTSTFQMMDIIIFLNVSEFSQIARSRIVHIAN